MSKRLPETDLHAILDATRPLWEDLRGERVLVTGGSGFFGRWLLESFAYANRELQLKAELVAISRNPARESLPGVSFVAADVRTLTANQVPGTFRHVIHAAAAASSQSHARDLRGTFDTIVTGTERVLALAEQAKTKRFLFLSSGAIYGRQEAELQSETTLTAPDPTQIRSAYAEGKRAAELLCALHAREDFAMIIARAYAFVGPGMELGGPFAIGCFIRDALNGSAIRIEGDGTPMRSYLYAADLAIWLWTLLFKGKAVHPYNVGGEHALSIADLAHKVATTLNPQAKVEVLGKPTGKPPERYVPSTARAREELGLKERFSLEEAIRLTGAWAKLTES